MSINAKRVAYLFDRCQKVGATNPVTDEGAPTREQVLELLDDATFAERSQVDELATHLKRLCRIVRKKDPSNPQAANAVKFMRCIGQLEPMRAKKGGDK